MRQIAVVLCTGVMTATGMAMAGGVMRQDPVDRIHPPPRDPAQSQLARLVTEAQAQNEAQHAHIYQGDPWRTSGPADSYTAIPMQNKLFVNTEGAETTSTLIVSMTGIVRLVEDPTNEAASIDLGILDMTYEKFVSVSTRLQVAQHAVRGHWIPFSITGVVPVAPGRSFEIVPGVYAHGDDPQWELRRVWLEAAIIDEGTLSIEPVDQSDQPLPDVGTGAPRVWLRADRNVVEQDGVVATWADARDDVGTTLDAEGGPTLTMADGHPVIAFDESDEQQIHGTAPVADMNAATVFLVSRFTDDATNHQFNINYIWSLGSAGLGRMMNLARATVSQPNQAYHFTGAGKNLGKPIPTGQFAIFVQVFDNEADDRHVLYKDGEDMGMDGGTEVTYDTDAPYLVMGNHITGDWHLTGEIAEFIIYPEVLSPDDRDAVSEYLLERYSSLIKTSE